MKLASPMYDLPELRTSTDAWCGGLADAFRRQGLGGCPKPLSEARDPDEPSRRKRLISASAAATT